MQGLFKVSYSDSNYFFLFFIRSILLKKTAGTANYVFSVWFFLLYIIWGSESASPPPADGALSDHLCGLNSSGSAWTLKLINDGATETKNQELF